jgi:hypothetical protein
MAEHSISVKFGQPIEIINRDLKITVRADGEVFGTLTISKGTIDWRPKKKWIGREEHSRLAWDHFDRVMRKARG